MNFLTTILLFAFCCTSAFSSPLSVSFNKPNGIGKTLTTRMEAPGCNLNICFAIDGSNSIHAREFRQGKDFVLDVTDIISSDNSVELAGFQYGNSAYKVSSLTADVGSFRAAWDAMKSKKDVGTSISSGITQCESELSSLPGEPKAIVVIGDGKNNMGSNPVVVADNFRQKNSNGKVYSVAIGNPDLDVLKGISGGENVFSVDDYLQLSLALDRLVTDVCGI